MSSKTFYSHTTLLPQQPVFRVCELCEPRYSHDLRRELATYRGVDNIKGLWLTACTKTFIVFPSVVCEEIACFDKLLLYIKQTAGNIKKVATTTYN